MQKNLLRIEYNVENYSAVWDTMKRLFCHVRIQHGKLFHCVGYVQWGKIFRGVGKLFCRVGYNMEDYFTVWDTMGKIILPMGYTVKKLIQGGIIFVYFHFSKATIKQNHFCGLTHPRGVLKNEKLRRFL